MSNPSYYVTQLRSSGATTSQFDWENAWQSKTYSLNEARRLYAQVAISAPGADVRLVKAFISEYSNTERVTEVVEFKAARP